MFQEWVSRQSSRLKCFAPEAHCAMMPVTTTIRDFDVSSLSCPSDGKWSIERTNVKNPESKCGPTPWFEAASLAAGYLTTYESVA